MNLVKVAVVGASGYSGQELIRILMGHPGVDLVCVTSRQLAGKSIGEVYPRFQHQRFADVKFTASDAAAVVASGAKVAFLALPHGLAHEYAKPLIEGGLKVIDLSADFRLKSAAVFEEFYGTPHPAPDLLPQSVYGLPEIYRDQIRASSLIASAGCYPTSILLPLIPLLKAGLLDPATITVSSMSGVSGAGKKAAVDYLYCECNESARAYGVPKHRHLSEIEQELSNAAGAPVVISFTPHLIPVNRGIVSTTYASLKPGVGIEAITAALEAAYKSEPFVRLQGPTGGADIKNVVFTNFIDIAWRHDPRTGRVVLMSAEDNLVKGASGQAVQSLNLLCGWPETEGLL
ncbi:MAG: N-acetyl-gamma-glutamyl-phosphate reductase [Chthoniobacteraceae bacterium]